MQEEIHADDQSTEQVVAEKPVKQMFVLKIPKPNMQVIMLSIVALITLFQTVQLIRINKQAKAAAVQVIPSTSGSSNDTNPNAPQSMVGGC